MTTLTPNRYARWLPDEYAKFGKRCAVVKYRGTLIGEIRMFCWHVNYDGTYYGNFVTLDLAKSFVDRMKICEN